MPNLVCCATKKNYQNFCSGLKSYDKQNMISVHTKIYWKMHVVFFSECDFKRNIRSSCDCGSIHKTQIRNTAVLFAKTHNVAKRVYSTYAYARHEDPGYKNMKLKAHSFVLYIYIYIYIYIYCIIRKTFYTSGF